MKTMEPVVEQAVDEICALGCDTVATYIAALRQAQLRPEYETLDVSQRAVLLEELQSIMAVYEAR